tara:strand:- start:423 stop:962 length:540 start_codon:yes stop_codon:yes gene_type:complete
VVASVLTGVPTRTGVVSAIVGQADAWIFWGPLLTVVLSTALIVVSTNLDHLRPATTTVLRFTVLVVLIATGAFRAALVAATGDATTLILITTLMGLTVVVPTAARAMLLPTSLQFTEALPTLRADTASAMTNAAVVVSLATQTTGSGIVLGLSRALETAVVGTAVVGTAVMGAIVVIKT